MIISSFHIKQICNRSRLKVEGQKETRNTIADFAIAAMATMAKNGGNNHEKINFQFFTKRRLTKFNGVKKFFDLHLKECGWQ